MLRRGVKEYDRFLISKHIKSQVNRGSPKFMVDDGSVGPVRGVTASGFRPTLLEQAVRALLHTLQFAVAYIVMLYGQPNPILLFRSGPSLIPSSLAMYYNGYIIICILIGAYVGSFIFHWQPLGG